MAAKTQALQAKDEFQARCVKAEERLRDLEEDQRALKKQFTRKMTKLKQQIEDSSAANLRLMDEVGGRLMDAGNFRPQPHVVSSNSSTRCALVQPASALWAAAVRT